MDPRVIILIKFLKRKYKIVGDKSDIGEKIFKKTPDDGLQKTDSRRRTPDDGLQTMDSGRRTPDDGLKTTESRRRTPDELQTT